MKIKILIFCFIRCFVGKPNFWLNYDSEEVSSIEDQDYGNLDIKDTISTNENRENSVDMVCVTGNESAQTNALGLEDEVQNVRLYDEKNRRELSVGSENKSVKTVGLWSSLRGEEN